MSQQPRLQTTRPSGQVVGVVAQVNVQPRQAQGVDDWQVNAQPASHSAVQLPLLQSMVLAAPSVRVQAELEHWTTVPDPAVMVQVPLLQSSRESLPRLPEQVELEQLSRESFPAESVQVEPLLQLDWHPSPQVWEQALVELQLRPQFRSQFWAQVVELLHEHWVVPASPAEHPHEPPSQVTGGGWGQPIASRAAPAATPSHNRFIHMGSISLACFS